ncbi:MAG: AgmX/PglI C-terminal domain-containing protein [Deltaproteobacteria bacterium]|jgi:hypothetical protein|nr:AgmX/PglI C-terminal domain-containing protein [Deltaproteobacteria bacterium]
MRQKPIVLLGAVTAFLLSCASAPEVQDDQPRPKRAKRIGRGGWASGQVQGDEGGMGMEMSMGVLDERAVDRAIKPHERALSNCFALAGDARKYLSGQVVMRFVVTGSGEVSDVQMIRNGLGNYSVESCLVAVGKRIVFPAPEGRRGTDFEYSMSFHSTGERSVIPWSAGEMARYLHEISSDLANCGNLCAGDVDVIAYIEPGGVVGSVGFASQGSLDTMAAVCAVALLRQIRVSEAAAAHSSVVLRTTFPLAMAFERPVSEPSRKPYGRRSRRR